jgi:hypothetical protein
VEKPAENKARLVRRNAGVPRSMYEAGSCGATKALSPRSTILHIHTAHQRGDWRIMIEWRVAN